MENETARLRKHVCVVKHYGTNVSWKKIRISILKNIMFCTDGKISVRINFPLFSTVVPDIIFVFLSCRPFVAITTLSTGLVGVEVTSVSWLGQLTVGV